MIEPFEFDRSLFLALNFDGGQFLDDFFWVVSGKLIWVPLYALILYMVYRRHGLRNTIIAVVLIGVAVFLTEQVCNFFKDYVPKLRPTHSTDLRGLISLVHNYRGALTGTVSAHAANASLAAILVAFLVRKRWLTILLTFWTMLVCYSRIYIGAHYPMDIIFGIITGIIMGIATYAVYKFIVKKIGTKS